jgi:sugar O-acyltransferase (sialic acid O-acetyltransferase NeuD family)
MVDAVYLLGGGGHGRVVLDLLVKNGCNVMGILDVGLATGSVIGGVPVLGGDQYLEQLNPDNVWLANGIGANPSVEARRSLFLKAKELGFCFRAYVHPSATLITEQIPGEGSQIMAGALLQCGVSLGANVVINTRASIDHDCNVEDHAFIGPGAILCGKVTVKKSAFIGAGAIILPSVQIGQNSIIGAGSVVNKSVPDGWTVVGNPATILRARNG